MAAETSPYSPQEAESPYKALPRGQAEKELGRFLTIVPNNDGLWQMANARKMKVISNVAGMPHWMAILVDPNLPIDNPPQTHEPGPGIKHPSDFKYSLEFRIKLTNQREAKIFVNAAEPGGTTSYPPHVHEEGEDGLGIFEHYWFFGKAYIGEGDAKRPVNGYEVVSPFTEHFIQAAPVEEGGEGVCSIILIENITNVPDHKIHKYKTTE